MSDFHLSAARGNATTEQFFDIQPVHSDCDGNDIDDRIDGTHFVEMDLIDGRSMHLGLGFGHRVEDSQREITLIVVQSFRLVDDLPDVTQMTMGVLFGMFHAKMFGAKSASVHFFQVQFDTRQIQRFDAGPNDL